MTINKEDDELRDKLFALWRAGRDDDDRYLAVDGVQAFIEARDEMRERELLQPKRVSCFVNVECSRCSKRMTAERYHLFPDDITLMQPPKGGDRE